MSGGEGRGIEVIFSFTCSLYSVLSGHFGRYVEESKVISLVVILQFETSGKWPDDLTAIQHIKAVFHIRLAELLKSECSLITAASRQHVDVLKVGCCKRISWI